MPRERYSRSVALEQDYVREVYAKIGGDLAQAKDPLKRAVESFLKELDVGSVVADVGCGSGRDLQSDRGLFSIGIDINVLQAELFREKGGEAIVATNLGIPIISENVDAVLSVGVLQHLSTEERRIRALKELTRILKIGGRILIAVRKREVQHSKDVLMPWYDVVENKKNKEERIIDQDSGEYDLDPDSDDSLSVSSSDEEEPQTPSSNVETSNEFEDITYPCFGERQSRSLDYDARSSNLTQNPQPLVPIHKCYNFVRKALRRFSSASSSKNECVQLERSQTVDSAVSFSSCALYERRISDLSDSLSSMTSSIQKQVDDNYIELLNIDDQAELSSRAISPTVLVKGLPPSKIRSDFSHPNRRSENRLMRSLSDVFKNIPSLWSSKEEKPFLDYDDEFNSSYSTSSNASKKGKKNLVRSQTTATCNSNFDSTHTLQRVGEFEMTLNDADKIINDFLEASYSSLEPVRTGDKTAEDRNVSQKTELLIKSLSSTEKKPAKSPTLHKYSGKDICRNPMDLYFSDEKYSNDFDSDNSLQVNALQCEDEYFDALENTENIWKRTTEEKPLNSSKTHSACSSNSKYDDRELLRNKNGKLELQLPFNSKDLSGHCDCSLEASERKHSANEVSGYGTDFNETRGIQIHHNTTDGRDHSAANDFFVSNFPESNSENYNRAENLTGEEFEDLSATNGNDNFHLDQGLLNMRHKHSFRSSPWQSNSSRHYFFVPNRVYHQTYLRTLGPFYEAECDDNTSLTSYHSMPELHNLSEFYQEYCIYRCTLMNPPSANLLPESSENLQTNSRNIQVMQSVEDNPAQGENSKTEENEIPKNIREKWENTLDRYRFPVSNNSNSHGENSNSSTHKTKGHRSNIKGKKLFCLEARNQEFCCKRRAKRRSRLMRRHSDYGFCSELEWIIRDRSMKIQYINDMLHFDCAVCAKYDGLFVNLPEKSDHIANNRSCIDKRTNLNKTHRKENFSNKLCSKKDMPNRPKALNSFDKPRINSFESRISSRRDKNVPQSLLSQHRSYTANENEFKSQSFIYNQESEIYPKKQVPESSRYKNKDNDWYLDTSSFLDHSKDLISSSGGFTSGVTTMHNPLATQQLNIRRHSEDLAPKNTSYKVKRRHSLNMSEDMFQKHISKNCEICLQTLNEHLSSMINNHSLSEIDKSPDFIHTELEKTASFCNENVQNAYFANTYSPSVSHIKHESKSTDYSKAELWKKDANPDQNISINNVESRSFGTKCASQNLTGTRPKIPSYKLNHPSHTPVRAPDQSVTSVKVGSDESNCHRVKLPECQQIPANIHIENTPEKPKDLSSRSVSYSYGHIYDEGASVVLHRYHHLFDENELESIIENYVEDLHILKSFSENSHWCVFAEKVKVWLI